MNTKLLNQVANAILDEPTKFRMEDWTIEAKEAPCGTAACIAGAVAIESLGLENPRALQELLEGDDSEVSVEQVAKTTLELSNEQADKLFMLSMHQFLRGGRWPEDFEEAYHEAKTPEDRADVAFWRIQHFIATDGKE